MFLRKFFFIILLFIFNTIVLSCGGGGGGTNITVNPPVNPPISPSGFSVITGFIYIGNDTTNYPAGLVSNIEIISIDKNFNQIDRKNITTNNGKFALNVGLSENGGRIVVNVSADGYTPGTKTIEYNSPDEFKNIKIGIQIDPIKKVIVSIQEINITGNKNKNINVVFYRNNGRVIGKVAPSDINGELLLSLSIPVKKLQAGTENVLVSFKQYKPSNPKDYENFPGTETDNGDSLVSIGFFTLDIKDPKTGKSPFENISPQLAKNNGEYYRLLTGIDCQQLLKIKNILGSLDEDTGKNGIQLTFYAFDSDKGVWVNAGEGTFVSSWNIKYGEVGENLNTVDTVWDYIIFNGCINDDPCSSNPNSTACIDVNNDGVKEDVSCLTNHVILNENEICTSINPVYAVVSVRNPNLTWKNLDYIKPKTEKIVINVITKDDKGNPVPTYVSILDGGNNCIEFASGYTSSQDGKATIETLKYCNPTKIYVEYMDPFTGLFIRYPNSPIDIHDNDTVQITITNPLKCKVEGKVINGETGTGMANIPVYIYEKNGPFYSTTFTDNDGNYRFSVLCSKSIYLTVPNLENNEKSFNVNNIVDNDEQSDNGTVVVMKDILMENNPPDGYGTLSTYSTKRGEKIRAYIFAWDTEGDLPIRYKLKFTDDNDNQIKSYTGLIQQNYGQVDFDVDTGDFPAVDGEYNVYLILVDSKYTGDINTLNQKFRKVFVGKLYISTQNAKPTIVSFNVLPSRVSSVGKQVTITGYGYDIDGDSLSSNVRYNCYDENNNLIDTGYTPHGEKVLTEGYETFTIPQNSNIKYCIFKWELSDGQHTSYSDEITVQIENTPPYTYIWPEEEVVSLNKSSTTIYAIVNDIDGDSVSCKWFVNGVLDNDQTGCSQYILDLTDFSANQNITVKLEATDGIDTSSSETTIHYGFPGNIGIIIQ